MSLDPGVRFGPYEVTALIGQGGMGEVYRARDTKLNRDVALKVLPSLFTSDPDRLARFHREAQVLASLNHPNIAIIYGLEEAGDVKALALELVEGPTLAECIEAGSLSPGAPAAAAEHERARQPRVGVGPHEHREMRERVGVRGKGLPLEEARSVAKQIADALEAAHEQGIMHRDLKPANVKVKDDGTVKVLDFGLAKLVPSEAGAAAGALSQAPPLTTPAATRMGVILGTVAYMAPEQARGKPVDKRADIWAFGSCVQ